LRIERVFDPAQVDKVLVGEARDEELPIVPFNVGDCEASFGRFVLKLVVRGVGVAKGH
jgi:hypothetical protein